MFKALTNTEKHTLDFIFSEVSDFTTINWFVGECSQSLTVEYLPS